MNKYKTTNHEIIAKLKECKNIVTKSSYENILLSRCSRGDIEAGQLLVNFLKGR